MRRHVFTIVGEDEAYQNQFLESGREVHQCLIDFRPTLQNMGEEKICGIAEAEGLYDDFLLRARRSGGKRHQVVLYYVGHGIEKDGIYFLGQSSASPRLKPFLDKLTAAHDRQEFEFELVLIVDACRSPHAFSESVAQQLLSAYVMIAASLPPGLGVQDEHTKKPVFSEALVSVLRRGVPGKPLNMTWEDMVDDHHKVAHSKHLGYQAKAYKQRISDPIEFARNAVFERETLQSYLRHLQKHVSLIPGFMSNAGRIPVKADDFPRLTQPMEISYALNKVPDHLNVPSDPQPASPGQGKDLSSHARVLRTVWRAKFLDDHPMVVVIGDPGCGKTWLAKATAAEICTNLLIDLERGDPVTTIASKLPIYGLFRDLVDAPEGAAADKLLSSAILPEGDKYRLLVKSVLDDVSGYVILDGLDEVDAGDEAFALGITEELRVENSRRRLCIFCREQSYLQLSDVRKASSDQVVARILPLHKYEIAAFVKAYLRLSDSEVEERINPLIERELVGNPLLLTFACLALSEKKDQLRTSFRTRTDVVGAAVKKLVRDWGRHRAGQFGSQDLQDEASSYVLALLGDLAAARIIGDQDLADELNRKAANTEGVRNLEFVLIGKDGQVAFVHKAIGEYLAAVGLSSGIGGNYTDEEISEFLERICWIRESENLIFDYVAISGSPAVYVRRFLDVTKDNTSRQRLRLAAALIATLPDSEDEDLLKLVSEVCSSVLLIYWQLLKDEKGSLTSDWQPKIDGDAFGWLPAVRALLRADPYVYVDSVIGPLSHDFSRLGSEPVSLAMKPRLEGRSDRLVQILLETCIEVNNFEGPADKRIVVQACFAVLLAEADHVARYPAHVMDVLELLVKEGSRWFFDAFWNVLTPSAQTALAEHDPKTFVECCLEPKTGWRFLKNYKAVGQKQIEERITDEVQKALEGGLGNYTGAGYSLLYLDRAHALSPALRSLALLRAGEIASTLYSSGWSQIFDSTVDKAFGINSLQEFLWQKNSLRSEVSQEDRELCLIEQILPFLLHQDFRVRAGAIRGLLRMQLDWREFRLYYCFAALDRLEYHQDAWHDTHLNAVEPSESWNDWVPQYEDTNEYQSTHDKMLWDLLTLEEATLEQHENLRYEPFQFPANETIGTFEDLNTEALFRFKPLHYLPESERVPETLKVTINNFCQNCPCEWYEDLKGKDPAKYLPILRAAFVTLDKVARVNATIQLGLLLGTQSRLYQDAKNALVDKESDYYVAKQICQCADSITWFTPKQLPERLSILQEKYESIRTSLASELADLALALDSSSSILLPTILQLPISPERHGEIVGHAFSNSPGLVARYMTFMTGQLERACRNGAVSKEVFLHLVDYATNAKEKDKAPELKGMKGFASRMFVRFLFPKQQVYPDGIQMSHINCAYALSSAFAYHPEADRFAVFWFKAMNSRIAWTWEGKMFIRFVSNISKSRGSYRNPYRQPIDKVLRRVLGGGFELVPNGQFRNDSDFGGGSPDISTVIAAISSGYRPKSLKKVLKGLGLTRPKNWIFSQGNRFVRPTEASGLRYFHLKDAKSTKIQTILGKILGFGRVVFFVALGNALGWNWEALQQFVAIPINGLSVLGFMFLSDRLSIIVASAGEVKWSTIEELSKIDLSRYRKVARLHAPNSGNS